MRRPAGQRVENGKGAAYGCSAVDDDTERQLAATSTQDAAGSTGNGSSRSGKLWLSDIGYDEDATARRARRSTAPVPSVGTSYCGTKHRLASLPQPMFRPMQRIRSHAPRQRGGQNKRDQTVSDKYLLLKASPGLRLLLFKPFYSA